MKRLVTIGGYGFSPDTFISSLKTARVTVFVDIRQRRGVRGSKYAFLNSTRLQQSLKDAGISYLYLRELAPTKAVREVQRQSDSASGTAKRTRAALSPAFVDAYKEQILAAYDPLQFPQLFGPDEVVALFCVEGAPAACHRSIVADKLAEALHVEVGHLTP